MHAYVLIKIYLQVWLLNQLCFHAFGRTHHKVHNLALYPERHSWCQATPIRQEIAHAPECEPTVIDNMVCLGACFSYSVPRAQDYQPIAPYCDKCDKTFSSWTVITLNCTKKSNGENYKLTRNVELITNCSCMECNDNGMRKVHSLEEDEFEDESLEDDLIDALQGNELEDKVRGLHVSEYTIPALHRLKGESQEIHEFRKVDDNVMITNNEIPSDDDHNIELMKKRIALTENEHDL